MTDLEQDHRDHRKDQKASEVVFGRVCRKAQSYTPDTIMTSGAHDQKCAFESCYTVDFLPISCNLCSKDFCTAHAFPDAHQCPSGDLPEASESSSSVNKRHKCAVPDCITSTFSFLDAEEGSNSGSRCSDCHSLFCLTHRHQSTHACPKAIIADTKVSKSKQLAAQAIAQVKASSSTQRAAPSVHSPVKSAKLKQIELMKMRRKAEPANPRDGSDLPMEERIYVKVTFESKDKVLWIKKDVVCGRALDLFSAKLGVHISPLQLTLPDGTILKTNELLATQIEDAADLIIERKSS
ncbi:hypothetical protein FRC15_007000 [Serendipita sp. 397]|nr:hypothetical protein FRC15_007000 [Serendipita sp. 397]